MTLGRQQKQEARTFWIMETNFKQVPREEHNYTNLEQLFSIVQRAVLLSFSLGFGISDERAPMTLIVIMSSFNG